MPDLPGEVAGLPEGGPATLEIVKAWLGIAPDDELSDERLNVMVAAVNDKVRTWPVAQLSADQDTWRGSTILGSVMLAARLDARGDSPEGVATFGSEGPLYLSRNDPDIAMLLNLGANAKPAVG